MALHFRTYSPCIPYGDRPDGRRFLCCVYHAQKQEARRPERDDFTWMAKLQRRKGIPKLCKVCAAMAACAELFVSGPARDNPNLSAPPSGMDLVADRAHCCGVPACLCMADFSPSRTLMCTCICINSQFETDNNVFSPWEEGWQIARNVHRPKSPPVSKCSQW